MFQLPATRPPKPRAPRADNRDAKAEGRQVLPEDPATPMSEAALTVPGRHLPFTTELDSDPSAPAPSPNGVIRVAVIEANRLVAEALTAFLNRAPDIRAVAEARNGPERNLGTGSPHVVLLNLGLENGNSLRVARDVKDNFPGAKVIVRDLPAHEEPSAFVNAGVSGFIMMDANLDVALNTVRVVAAGLKVLPERMTTTDFSEVAKEADLPGGSLSHTSLRMTPREQEVSFLIAEGLSNKAIGKRLHISYHTVKSHVRNIMEKLEVHSRLQIAAYFLQRDANVANDGE